MKRLLLIGVAAIAFAAIPALSASAMPRATANTLVGDTDRPIILVHGGMGTVTWADTVITMAGAGATIAVGDDRRAQCLGPP
jgi:hypothetical protein